jgi:hypothetical protein
MLGLRIRRINAAAISGAKPNRMFISGNSGMLGEGAAVELLFDLCLALINNILL